VNNAIAIVMVITIIIIIIITSGLYDTRTTTAVFADNKLPKATRLEASIRLTAAALNRYGAKTSLGFSHAYNNQLSITALYTNIYIKIR
jgi:hypothetical protein